MSRALDNIWYLVRILTVIAFFVGLYLIGSYPEQTGRWVARFKIGMLDEFNNNRWHYENID